MARYSARRVTSNVPVTRFDVSAVTSVGEKKQHLLTALASAKWSAETISWNLGDSTSYLELGTPDFTTEQMEELEKLSNEATRAGYLVTPSWHSVADVNEGKVKGLRKSSKKLPESVLGPVRVVTIAEVHTNTCCRTPDSCCFIFTYFLFFIFVCVCVCVQ